MTILSTARLRLREASPLDAAFLLRLINEPGWHRYINDPGVRTLEQTREWMEGWLPKSYPEQGSGFGLVERLADGEPLGICGLLRRTALEGPDLGYALLAEHEGFGYAREAAEGCVRHAREVLGWTELLAITSPENPRSHALLRKLGFVDGELRQLDGYAEPSRVWRLRL
ncbi:MAG: GNAT family N-acetyltransferase [Inhella sp.]